MKQRGVEIALGRLTCDEDIRCRFQKAPALVLHELISMAAALGGEELRALASREPCAVEAFSRALDARLQKAVRVEGPA